MNSSWSSGLGSLDTLPLELRLCIYDELARNQLEDCKYISALAQVSHELLSEVAYHHGIFWSNTVLRFKISPRHERNAWLTVESNTIPEIYLRDLDDAISRGFRNLPYHLLKGIKIEIGCPSRTDQGQILCVWKKCFDLVKLLGDRKVPFLAPLEICLVDTCKTASWYNARKSLPQKSLPIIEPGCSISVEEADFLIALTPFVCLKGAAKASISVPEALRRDLKANSQYNGITTAERLLERGGPAASPADADDQSLDDSLWMGRDDLYLKLETRLDFAAGRTANQLRLERFATWFDAGRIDAMSPVENEFRRIAWWSPAPEALVTHVSNLSARYMTMRALNPSSLYHRFGPKQSWHTKYFDCVSESVTEGVYTGVAQDGWDTQAWYDKYQQQGLPAFNSRKSRNRVHNAVMGSRPEYGRSLDDIWRIVIGGSLWVVTRAE